MRRSEIWQELINFVIPESYKKRAVLFLLNDEGEFHPRVKIALEEIFKKFSENGKMNKKQLVDFLK